MTDGGGHGKKSSRIQDGEVGVLMVVPLLNSAGDTIDGRRRTCEPLVMLGGRNEERYGRDGRQQYQPNEDGNASPQLLALSSRLPRLPALSPRGAGGVPTVPEGHFWLARRSRLELMSRTRSEGVTVPVDL